MGCRARDRRTTTERVPSAVCRAFPAGDSATVRKGAPALCSSTAPTPPTIPAPGERVHAIDQFRSDPGWRGIMFSMDQPVCFQYRIEAGDRAFTASARGRRREKDGATADVTLILRGRLDHVGALWTSAIEEVWTVSGAGA